MPATDLGAYPVQVAAAPRSKGNQVVFFQTCALPAALVESLHLEGVERALLRGSTQWRLDYPLPSAEAVLPEDLTPIEVVESVLTRGTTPLCPVSLERFLDVDESVIEDRDAVIEALRYVALVPTCRFQPLCFDSREEQSMYERLRRLLEAEGLCWQIVPQMELASISSMIDPSSGQRGDLLLVRVDRKPILVEVDGAQHDEHRERDAARDRALKNEGVRCVRVRANEVRDGRGRALEHLEKILRESKPSRSAETGLSIVVRLCKYYHQVQLALVVAVKGGWLPLEGPWSVGVALPGVLRDDDRAHEICRLAVSDLRELFDRTLRLYGRGTNGAGVEVVVIPDAPSPGTGELDVLIGPGDGSVDDLAQTARATLLISDICLPKEIHAPLTATAPGRLSSPNRDDARWFLQYLFRKDDFWEGQWETIERILRGQDSIVLLPTGGGKSIAFQLAAMLLPGRCIVVAPIISLIDDQMDNLASVGIDRAIGITSQLATGERERALQAFRSGHYLFCYVAPERFQTVPFREALRGLTTTTPIALIAIDEAHCVSEWGHDFRTAYLNLGRITREYCKAGGVVPPLVALTGTASRIVLKDVQRVLGITAFDAIITPKTFDRPELRFTILRCRSSEKVQRLLGFLERLPTQFGVSRAQFFRPMGSRTCAGLVFCPHVNGQYGVVDQSKHLVAAFGVEVGVYGGKAPTHWDRDRERWEASKQLVARRFKRNQLTVLACTKAFGMGIDKPNIRYTVHIGLPSSIEAFYQEAGRAGRDRRRAECAIVLSNDDEKRSQYVLSPATPLDEVARIVTSKDRADADDVIRALWFHVRAFRGERDEVADVATMLDRLGDVETRRRVNVSWQDAEPAPDRWRQNPRERAERALHRLVVLGVVEDYTVNFGSREFEVYISGATQEEIAAAFGRYAAAYQQRLGEEAESTARELFRQPHRDYVLAVAERLVAFIYQHIELARRRSLNELLQATMVARTGEDLRRRLLAYLEQTEWDERLEAIRSSPRGGVDRLEPVLEDLLSTNDAASLRAAAGRALASYPDVPGLLILRGVAEALSFDTDAETVRENIFAALDFAFEKFRLDVEEVARALGQSMSRARSKVGAAELLVDACLRSRHCDRDLVRALLRHVSRGAAGYFAWWLIGHIAAECDKVLVT